MPWCSQRAAQATCFVIIAGVMDVSINARGRQQLLATLPAGSIFGQVSVIDGAPRSATCTVRSDAVLLELERKACERLLQSGSPLALKFLAILNEGLIAALRGADLRLMHIEQDALVFGTSTA
jgi:CRP-like cAMP-binding protein